MLKMLKVQNWMVRSLAAALFMFAAQAQATLSLTPADTSCLIYITSNLNASAVEGFVSSCFHKNLSLTLLYKANVDGTEDGSLSGSYDTFFNSSTDPSGGSIQFNGGPWIACPECFLLVKDGNHSPAQYLFDIGTWNGTDEISLSNFWPGPGAISNVAIWGFHGQTVAEPATLAMLGLGLFGLGVARRRLK
jgi:hypothetical protein